MSIVPKGAPAASRRGRTRAPGRALQQPRRLSSRGGRWGGGPARSSARAPRLCGQASPHALERRTRSTHVIRAEAAAAGAGLRLAAGRAHLQQTHRLETLSGVATRCSCAWRWHRVALSQRRAKQQRPADLQVNSPHSPGVISQVGAVCCAAAPPHTQTVAPLAHVRRPCEGEACYERGPAD
jgi:hypothetical protein